MPDHVLAVDLGTTATKAMIVDGAGAVVAEQERPSELRSPGPGYAEMDAEAWWDHVVDLVPALLADADLTAADLAVVGVSGMVPTLIPLDGEGRPLRASIQQNDARATTEIDVMRAALPDAVARTGSEVTAQSIGPKWRWIRRHEPDVADRTVALTGSYGFVTHRLTGELRAESNWALESGLRSIDDGWDQTATEAAELDPSLLPPIAQPTDVVGEVTAAAADATGLRTGTPVVAGCADHVASAYAAGLADDGDVLLKLGGAGDILLVVDRPVVDARLFLDHHPVPGRWLSNGCMAATGSLLRWFDRELAGGAGLADLDRAAAELPPGSDGLLMLPYFLGEKTPLQDPLARGAFVGLHLGHTRAHLFRATLEAVAFAFEHHLEVFRELGLPVGRARVTNGGSRSTLWKQVLADVTGLPLEVPAVVHGSAFGTALVAGGAVGALDPPEVLARTSAPTAVVEPDSAARERHRADYLRWRSLEAAIRPISHELAREQRR